MKILFVSNLYPPHFIGGYEIACQDTVALFLGAGHECRVLVSDYKRPGVENSQSEIGKVSRCLLLHHNWGTDCKTHSYSTVCNENRNQIEATVNDFGPDFVYFWNIYGLGLGIVDVIRTKQIPYTIHLMDFSIREYSLTPRNLFSKVLHRKDVGLGRLGIRFPNAIAISEYLAEEFSEVGRKSKVVAYPFVDQKIDIPVKAEYKIDKLIRGVYLGQIEPHKGVKFLCEAIEAVRNQLQMNIHLDIFGRSVSGFDKEILRLYGNFISIYSSTPREEILSKLKNYDLGFFPSIWMEPFGIAQIELMKAGLPVISSAQGGASEPLTKDNSVRFRSGDVEDLVSKISVTIKRYDLIAKRMGQTAARDIQRNFSSENYMKRVWNHLSEQLSQSDN